MPTATPCTAEGTACENRSHDHLDYVDAEGNDIEQPVPMVCRDCDAPTHYDRGTDEYRHDSPAATCWLTLPGVSNDA